MSTAKSPLEAVASGGPGRRLGGDDGPAVRLPELFWFLVIMTMVLLIWTGFSILAVALPLRAILAWDRYVARCLPRSGESRSHLIVQLCLTTMTGIMIVGSFIAIMAILRH